MTMTVDGGPSLKEQAESLFRPMPNLESIKRYVDACRSHLALLIASRTFTPKTPTSAYFRFL